MDYGKTKEEAKRRRDDLLARQQQIPREKAKLDSELEDIRRELIGLEQILDGVEFVTSDEPALFWEPLGLTDSIRKILSETTEPLIPTQIRYALERNGVKGTSPKNLLINIHKVLDRIGSELTQTTTPEGKTAYKREIPFTSLGFFPSTDPNPAVTKSLEGWTAKMRQQRRNQRHTFKNSTLKLADQLAAERACASGKLQLPESVTAYLAGVKKEQDKKK